MSISQKLRITASLGDICTGKPCFNVPVVLLKYECAVNNWRVIKYRCVFSAFCTHLSCAYLTIFRLIIPSFTKVLSAEKRNLCIISKFRSSSLEVDFVDRRRNFGREQRVKGRALCKRSLFSVVFTFFFYPASCMSYHYNWIAYAIFDFVRICVRLEIV